MKSRFISIILLLVLLVTATGNARAISQDPPGQRTLVYVNLSSPDDQTRFASTQLPAYLLLDGGLLTGADPADQQALQAAGLSYKVLDDNLHPGTYYLAQTLPGHPSLDFATFGQVLLNTSQGTLLRMDPARIRSLSQAGAELQAVTLTPKPLPIAQRESIFSNLIEPDPVIQGMIDQVSETQIYTYDRQLAGELPVWVDGAWYTITTRDAFSGVPIEKTTSYVGEHMADLGMDVEYHVWDGNTNPNVIGQITGSTNPDDIFIIGGHLDDVYGAPGADDNGSGSVATLIAADILSQYQWGCTLRFALWNGEEYGLLGSQAYAQRAYQQDENILGYLNLDMIAWNTISTPPSIYLGYSAAVPPSLDLANLFKDVVAAYNIDLIPTIGQDFLCCSDHGSFLQYGFPAILGIEGEDDFNPYYHSSQDTPAHTDPTYFTNFVKASIATYAHMSGCLIPPADGSLDGHVTAASDGSPLEGVDVTADNGRGISYNAVTDPTGYYTMTIHADTYTVTASLDGYLPQSQSAVINPHQTTTLDFALESACEQVSNPDFSWLPPEPFNGDLITFTATASGTQPIDFSWDFGDTFTDTGATVTHAYIAADVYTTTLSASNDCTMPPIQVNKAINVLQLIQRVLLPFLSK